MPTAFEVATSLGLLRNTDSRLSVPPGGRALATAGGPDNRVVGVPKAFEVVAILGLLRNTDSKLSVPPGGRALATGGKFL